MQTSMCPPVLAWLGRVGPIRSLKASAPTAPAVYGPRGASWRSTIERVGAGSAFVEQPHRRLAARDPQRLERPPDMAAHRHLGDREARGDLRSRQPGSEQLEDLPLSLGELEIAPLLQQPAGGAASATSELL